MELLERLRERGVRLTSQRRVVAEILVGEHVHLTADEVHQRAVSRLPEISRATVYNTLNEFVALGEVIEVSGGGRARRYDPNAHSEHQHLQCDPCGTILDVAPDGDLLAPLREGASHGFRLTGVEVLFHGVCPACQVRTSPR